MNLWSYLLINGLNGFILLFIKEQFFLGIVLLSFACYIGYGANGDPF